MFRAAISQTTTSSWELPAEIDRACEHGFDRLSLWRPKLSNVGSAAAARMLRSAGVQPSSLQWAGGFTGGDGRSFTESVADALEAIDAAAEVGSPVLVVHGGCRGGHTLAHARRLLLQALELIAPAAAAAGVILALKPLHPAAVRSSLVRTPGDALEIVAAAGHASVRLALDLWHIAEDSDLLGLLPAVAPVTALVQVADRAGPPTQDLDRLPSGRGTLPLEWIAALLVEHGYTGDFEFDPVGECVEERGYEGILADARRTADAWLEGLTAPADVPSGPRIMAARAAGALATRGVGSQFRPAGSRRSHASSQVVSPG